jgi:hypothetical protein
MINDLSKKVIVARASNSPKRGVVLARMSLCAPGESNTGIKN